MEVVLLEDVKALGKKGQIVKVNEGYARNFILPKKLGVEIGKAIEDQIGLEIDKKKLVLPEPIKTFGTHEVPVKLHKDVVAKLAVKVTEA